MVKRLSRAAIQRRLTWECAIAKGCNVPGGVMCTAPGTIGRLYTQPGQLSGRQSPILILESWHDENVPCVLHQIWTK